MNLIETSDGYGDLVQRLRGRSAFLRNKHGRVKSPEVMEEAATEIESLTAQVERMREACEGIADDYMTSEQHHPNYVLISTIKFEEICAALSYRGDD